MSLPAYFAVPWRSDPLLAPCSFDRPTWAVPEPPEPAPVRFVPETLPITSPALRYVVVERHWFGSGGYRVALYATAEDYEARIVPALGRWSLAEPLLVRLAEVAAAGWGTPYRICSGCHGSGYAIVLGGLTHCRRCRGLRIVRPMEADS